MGQERSIDIDTEVNFKLSSILLVGRVRTNCSLSKRYVSRRVLILKEVCIA